MSDCRDEAGSVSEKRKRKRVNAVDGTEEEGELEKLSLLRKNYFPRVQ